MSLKIPNCTNLEKTAAFIAAENKIPKISNNILDAKIKN